MRFVNLHVRTAAFAALILAICSCQTARKPVPLLPPATAPSLKTPAPTTQAESQPPLPAAPAPQPQAAPPKSVEPAPVALEPKPAADAVADLIAQVEKEYQAGLADYQAGKAEAAKQDFDKAFNALLGSKLDIRSDPRLEKEFDRIVEGVNRLDLGGLAASGLGGDTEAQQQEQKSEPAPIDETNEVAPAADPGVKAKAQAEIKSTRSDLPLMMTDQVAGYISYFSNRGRGTFERAFARSGRYHDMMVSILRQEGVPQDLIYLAQAESGFHPLAVSRVGARGIWQFMASRARGYGLSHNMWVDDRQDPEKSTRAAAHHLKDLYNQFGDWYLAMAAYNSGPGTVQAAVKRTGYADFWELYRRNVLPKETRNYVPIILAVTIMTKNLSQYGFEDVSMDEPAKYDAITINYPVDLRLVAQCIGATQVELQELNPSLLRLTTPREGKFELHLPAGTKDQYQTAIAAIPTDVRLWWRYHTVHSGDTLASLSRTYRIPAKSITQANHLDGNDLDADAKLVIPIPAGKHVSDTATYARRITRYKVHVGDTVETVAENFGISPQMLRRWNGLRGDSLRGRKVLALHLPVTPTSESTEAAASRSSKSKRSQRPGQTADSKKPVRSSGENEDGEDSASVVHHKVRTGETLYSIANTYKTTVDALKRDNHDVAVLRPGMILIVQQSR
jgi:membrane-bound lytic murein transglycosylase D